MKITKAEYLRHLGLSTAKHKYMCAVFECEYLPNEEVIEREKKPQPTSKKTSPAKIKTPDVCGLQFVPETEEGLADKPTDGGYVMMNNEPAKNENLYIAGQVWIDNDGDAQLIVRERELDDVFFSCVYVSKISGCALDVALSEYSLITRAHPDEARKLYQKLIQQTPQNIDKHEGLRKACTILYNNFYN